MGRIRTSQIKTIADLLIGKYGIDKFSGDFDKNKELLNGLPEELPSKTILNKTAGYIAFLYRKRKAEQKKLLEKSAD